MTTPLKNPSEKKNDKRTPKYLVQHRYDSKEENDEENI